VAPARTTTISFRSYRWRTLSDIAAQHELYLAIEARSTQGTTIAITAPGPMRYRNA
jgi:hypothetical protein